MLLAQQHNLGPVTAFEVALAPLGKPLKSVYIFHVDSLLVDTGPYHLRKKVVSMLNFSKIEKILLTHHHEDHSGNAALLSNRCKTEVYLHPYGVAKLSKGFNILPYQHLLFGKAPSVQAEICPEIIEGDNITIRAIHTPGHSKDHTVYLVEEEGWLFTGDLYVGEKIRFFRVDENIHQQIDSLRKILKLDFDTLYCSHRAHLPNGRTLLKRKLDYLEGFREKVQALHQNGSPEKEIIKRLRVKNDMPIKLFTMGNASFSHMVKSSLNTILESRSYSSTKTRDYK